MSFAASVGEAVLAQFQAFAAQAVVRVACACAQDCVAAPRAAWEPLRK